MNSREHLLTCLMEECSEIQKPICKALRFGENDHYPNKAFPTATSSNIQDISDELDDLQGVVELLIENGILLRVANREKIEAKKIKVNGYMEYARNVGALKD